ncbi:phosphohistidine phosphatase SixA, partial [bacterium]|nr:phosphohistidine phosphatase SixA [bacterium]
LGEQYKSLMIVGHLPHLSRLAGLLLTGDPENQVVEFINSGVVCLTGQDKQWTLSWAVVPDNIIL